MRSLRQGRTRKGEGAGGDRGKSCRCDAGRRNHFIRDSIEWPCGPIILGALRAMAVSRDYLIHSQEFQPDKRAGDVR